MDPSNESPTAVTQAAPAVVTSSQAETAVNGAANTISQYNTNTQANGGSNAGSTPTSGSNGTQTPPTSNGGTGGSTATPTETPAVNYGSYTDPATGETSYYAQTGTDANGNPTYASDPTDPGTALNAEIGAVSIPSPGVGGLYNPNTPGTNVDSQGNIFGTSIPAAQALGTPGTVQDYLNQVQQGNQAIMTSAQNTQQYLTQWQSGTIQMNPAQQQIISTMQQQMQALIGFQQEANASYVATTQAGIFGSQMNRYSPQGAAQALNTSISMSNLTLMSLQATQGNAIATMQEGFQKEDYDEVVSANQQYQTAVEATQDELQKSAAFIQQSIVDARNYNLQAQNQIFTQQMSSASLSLQQKNDLFQNYISSQNLTLAQKTQAETFWYNQQQIAVDKMTAGAALENANVAQETYAATFGDANLWGNPYGGGAPAGAGSASGTTPTANAPQNSDGSTPQNVSGWHYDPSNGQFLDGNGNPITGAALTALQNSMSGAGMQAFSDGVAYFDPSRIPNANAQQGASTAAGEKNIPTLDTQDASAINNAESAKTELIKMYTYWIGTQPATALTGELAAQAEKLGSNMNPTPDSIATNQAGYNSAKTALYAMLSSLSQSKRANGGEYEVGTGATPTDNNAFGFNTLQATGQTEFQAINQNLNALINGVLPQVSIQDNPVFQNSTDLLNTLAPTTSGSTPATSSASSGFGAAY